MHFSNLHCSVLEKRKLRMRKFNYYAQHHRAKSLNSGTCLSVFKAQNYFNILCHLSGGAAGAPSTLVPLGIPLLFLYV